MNKALDTMSIKTLAYRIFISMALAAVLAAPVAGAARHHRQASGTHGYPVAALVPDFGGGEIDPFAPDWGGIIVQPLGYTWGA